MLLWQGQLVSSVGDAVYRIALGFWILALTGSTALMGALLAASVLPRVVLSPLGGTLADRSSRKWLLVSSDALAGVAVLLLGLAAWAGVVEVWMAFVVAVLLGVASSLFDPTVDAAIADLVPRRRLSQANAAFALLGAGAAILGNAIGGVLYQAVGAALLFVANGVTFLLSAASEALIRLPPVSPPTERPSFRRELASGLRLVRRDPGLGALYFATGSAHVGTTAVFVLLVPLFDRAGHLGAGAYGLVMSAMSVGALAGFGSISLAPVPAARRRSLFIGLGLIQVLGLGLLPWLGSVIVMAFAMAVAGATIAVQDALLTTALQLAVPATLRGRIFGLRASLVLSLGALSMATAGLLAERFALDHLIAAAAAVAALGYALVAVHPAAREIFSRSAAEGVSRS